MKKIPSTGILALALLTASCATTGSRSTSAKPVFYPNAKLNSVGQDKANEDAEVCINNAKNAGLTPEEKDNAVAHGAARGAAVGGVVGAVSGVVRGKGVDGVVNSGAGGAVIGGAAGATRGAMTDRVSHTFRNFVQRCLRDKGYDVIGWN